MIYLRTGANGAGKTLLTLKDVREKSLAETRPVYYNGRFDLTADFGWIKGDVSQWQSWPDGSIVIVDECHNDMPLRKASEACPPWISALAEHRRHGFDFYLITQHPLNLDAFVRRLIGSPGWHQHLKRASGAPLVSVLEWPAVNTSCEKAGSGTSAATTMRPFPKEVYKWYQSTSLDTAKIKIPFQAKLLGVALLIIPVLGYYSYKAISGRGEHVARAIAPMATVDVPRASGGARGGDRAVLSPAEYVASFTPRVEGLAYTASRYDELTRPVVAPFPAACLSMGKRCECYTQQGTKLPVPVALCSQIAAGGFFKDWDNAKGGPVDAQAQPGRKSDIVRPVVVADAVASPVGLPTEADHGYGLRRSGYLAERNASTVSVVKPPVQLSPQDLKQ